MNLLLLPDRNFKKVNTTMMLLEFFNFSDQSKGMVSNKRYNNARDSSVLKKSDTRKIRLTLRQINQLRMQSEAREAEKDAELSFIRQMYARPVESPGM